jgi:hypothetical protein
MLLDRREMRGFELGFRFIASVARSELTSTRYMSAHSNQSSAPLFKVLAETGEHIEIIFNDRPLSVLNGGSVAAVLLAAGVTRFRATPVSGAPRAPYCMMGACFECLVEIDGVPSRQSCMVSVRNGMTVRTLDGGCDLLPSGSTVAVDSSRVSSEDADGR